MAAATNDHSPRVANHGRWLAGVDRGDGDWLCLGSLVLEDWKFLVEPGGKEDPVARCDRGRFRPRICWGKDVVDTRARREPRAARAIMKNVRQATASGMFDWRGFMGRGVLSRIIGTVMATV